MDGMLERLNKLYPDSKYVKIPKYDPSKFEGRIYNSKEDAKTPMNSWKQNPLRYEDALTAAEAGYRIGWIVPKGYVVVDVDNKDNPDSQKYLFKTLDKWKVVYSYNLTSKGAHILMKDPSCKIKSIAGEKCALNIEIDTRANETGYIVLPTNDPHRKWGELIDIKRLDCIPSWLKPIGVYKGTPSFIGLGSGSRNTELFRWTGNLRRTQQLEQKDIEAAIKSINEDFLEEPLPPKEIQTIIRTENGAGMSDSDDEDGSTPKKKSAKQTPKDRAKEYYDLADTIVNMYDILYSAGDMYRFNGNYYSKLDELDIENIITEDCGRIFTKGGRKEVIEFVKIRAKANAEDLNRSPFKIACKNGVINLFTGMLEDAERTDYNTIFIPHNYNPDPPYSKRIDSFMLDVTGGDPCKIKFLYEIAAYCLCKKNFLEKFVIIQGEGGTGKSTYLNLLQRLCGEMNCAHIELSKFDADFHVANLNGKLVNICDDLAETRPLENTGTLKSIVSGNIISAKPIYKDVINFVPFCTLVFACNKFPYIADKSSGLFRRMILVQLDKKIENMDRMFMDHITEQDMEYFLFKVVEAAGNIISSKKLSIELSEQSLSLQFKRRQSPINEWVYEKNITLADLNNRTPFEMYSMFKDWAVQNGYNKIPAAFTFREDICSLYKIQTVRVINPGVGNADQRFSVAADRDPDYNPLNE